jgi:hypothetical protein
MQIEQQQVEKMRAVKAEVNRVLHNADRDGCHVLFLVMALLQCVREQQNRIPTKANVELTNTVFVPFIQGEPVEDKEIQRIVTLN